MGEGARIVCENPRREMIVEERIGRLRAVESRQVMEFNTVRALVFFNLVVVLAAVLNRIYIGLAPLPFTLYLAFRIARVIHRKLHETQDRLAALYREYEEERKKRLG